MKNPELLMTCLLGLSISACGGGDALPPIMSEDGMELYFGYYEESPVADTEDPTPGMVYALLPETDGSFNGEFFFSYAGCVGSYDTGLITASKTAGQLAGVWAGDVDGLLQSGDFSAISSDGLQYSGSWNRDGGTEQFNDSCGYTFAGYGAFLLYRYDNSPQDITVDTGDPLTPLFLWGPGANAVIYKINILDKACLESGGNIDSCLSWSHTGFDTDPGLIESVIYGNGQNPAVALASGSDYIVTLMTFDMQGTVIDFASSLFSVPG